jgi:hypothetical protein
MLNEDNSVVFYHQSGVRATVAALLFAAIIVVPIMLVSVSKKRTVSAN